MGDFQEQFPGLHDKGDSLQFLLDFDYPPYIGGDTPLAPMDLLDANDYNIPFPFLPTSPGPSPPNDRGSVSPTNLHIDTRLTLNPSYDKSSAISTPVLGPVMDNQLPTIHIHPSPQPVENNLSVTPVSQAESPLWSVSPVSPVSPIPSAQVDQCNDDDDEVDEAMLPHVTQWFWVQRFADIATGTRIFVPQRIYRPYTEADQKRYITDCELKQTIYFLSSNPYEFGLTLDNAIKSKHKDLQDKDDPMFAGCGPSVSIRVEWPGYRSWTKQIPTNDFKTPKGPITRAKLAKNLANCVKRFIEWAAKQPMETNADRRWKVGPKHIKVEDLMLVSLHHVSKGSWQPQLRLRRPLPELTAHRPKGIAATTSMIL